jgi:type IV pilus assembly protein PilV
MKTCARGFTLVESMIALLLLSLGLLGAWAILLASLQGHAGALRQARAVQLVRDMADRIRANPVAGAGYDSSSGPATVSLCDAASPCDSAQLAATDLAAFAEAAERELPGSGATTLVSYQPAVGANAVDRYDIVLRWRDAHDAHTVGLQLRVPPVTG